jgi:hypothetical protein
LAISTTKSPSEPAVAREIDRALAKLTAATVRAADELAAMRGPAAVLPRSVRVQLSKAIEELDLLRHYLHKTTITRVIAATDSLQNSRRERA